MNNSILKERISISIVLLLSLLMMQVGLIAILGELMIQSKIYHAIVLSSPDIYSIKTISVIQRSENIRIIIGVQSLIISVTAYLLYRSINIHRVLWLFVFVFSSIATLLLLFMQY